MTRSVQPASSIAAAVSAATDSPGSHPGSWGAFLISTLTTMPSQTARASASRGTWAGRSDTPRPATDAEPGDLGVVVDSQGPVGRQADVQLDPVGAQAPGLGEGLQRVLRRSLLCNPYGRRPPSGAAFLT